MIQLTPDGSNQSDRIPDLPIIFRALEHGMMRPEGFFCVLRDKGFDITPEFERIVDKQFQSGSLSYTTLIRLLHGESKGDRRCRKTIPKHCPSDLIAQLPSRISVDLLKSSDSSACETVYPATSLPSVVREYVSGSLPTHAFVDRLSKHGVTIVPELEQLIRRHEADNSVKFADFARVLLWMGVYNM